MTTPAELGMASLFLPNGQEVWVPRGTMDLAKATATIPVGERPVSATNLAALARSLGAYSATLGPGQPISPTHPEEGEPRRFAYRPGANIAPKPRSDEEYSFETLRAFTNRYEIARLCIEKRTDDLRALTWAIRPRRVEGETREERKARRRKLEDPVNEATGFFLTPNREDGWISWLSQWANDFFGIDAATLYLRPTLGGDLFSLEVIDGATIKVLLDQWGRLPQPPEPAYLQTINGMPWGWYSRDQLIYSPYWQRAGSAYGHPPIEWVLLTANRAIRRATLDLSRFTEGNLPVAFLRMAGEMNDTQLRELREYLDEMLVGNDVARSRVIPIPGGPGTGLDMINPDPTTEGEEWLLYLTCWAYGVNPMELGFVRNSSGLGGKGFAEVGRDYAFRRSVRNPGLHLKGIIDGILAKVPRWAELEMDFDGLDQTSDKLVEAQTTKIYVDMGARSPDDVADHDLDLDPPGIGFYVAGQVTLVSELLKPPEPTPPALLPFTGEQPKPEGKPEVDNGTPGDEAPDTPSADVDESTTDEQAPGAAKGGKMGKAAGFDDDLDRWERKALKAVRSGRPAGVSFESDAIPSETTVTLRDRLAKVTDVAGVREAFDLAKAAGESDAP